MCDINDAFETTIYEIYEIYINSINFEKFTYFRIIASSFFFNLLVPGMFQYVGS